MSQAASRLRLLSPIFAVAFTALAQADDIKTADGRTLKTVTVTRVDPDGLVMATDSGVQKMKFAALSPEAQRKYGYDPAKEARFLQAAKNKTAALESAAAVRKASLESAAALQAATEKARQEDWARQVKEATEEEAHREEDRKSKVLVMGKVDRVAREGIDICNSSFVHAFILNYPQQSSVAEGDFISVYAFPAGVIQQYTVGGVSISTTLHAYSVTKPDPSKP